MDKSFTEKLIYSLIHLDTEYIYILSHIIEKYNFFKLPVVNDTIPKEYIQILEDIFRYKNIGKSSEDIKELIKSNPLYKGIYREIEAKYEGKISYNEMEETVKEFARKIKIYRILNFAYQTIPIVNEVNTLLAIDEAKIRELMDRISSLYDDLSIEYKIEEKIFNKDEVDRYINEIIEESISNKKHKVIKTGIEYLDLAFDDIGLRTKELMIISSGWGIGKTRFVTSLGANFVRQGYVVYHITIENSLEDVEKLYATAFTNMSYDYIKLLTNKLRYVNDEEEKKKIEEKINQYRELLKLSLKENRLIIKKFPIDDCRAIYIESYIKQCISRGLPKPDVIIVDHIDLLTPNRGDYGSLFLNGQAIAKELKKLAEVFDALVIAPSQLNVEGVKALKKGYDTGGELGSRSRAKFEIASYHITLNQTQDEFLNNIARLYIDKNRHGLSMLTIPIYFDKSKLIVNDIHDIGRIIEIYEGMVVKNNINGSDEDDDISSELNLEEGVLDKRKVKKILKRIINSIRVLEERKKKLIEENVDNIENYVDTYTYNDNTNDVNDNIDINNKIENNNTNDNTESDNIINDEEKNTINGNRIEEENDTNINEENYDKRNEDDINDNNDNEKVMEVLYEILDRIKVIEEDNNILQKYLSDERSRVNKNEVLKYKEGQLYKDYIVNKGIKDYKSFKEYYKFNDDENSEYKYYEYLNGLVYWYLYFNRNGKNNDLIKIKEITIDSNNIKIITNGRNKEYKYIFNYVVECNRPYIYDRNRNRKELIRKTLNKIFLEEYIIPILNEIIDRYVHNVDDNIKKKVIKLMIREILNVPIPVVKNGKYIYIPINVDIENNNILAIAIDKNNPDNRDLVLVNIITSDDKNRDNNNTEDSNKVNDKDKDNTNENNNEKENKIDTIEKEESNDDNNPSEEKDTNSVENSFNKDNSDNTNKERDSNNDEDEIDKLKQYLYKKINEAIEKDKDNEEKVKLLKEFREYIEKLNDVIELTIFAKKMDEIGYLDQYLNGDIVREDRKIKGYMWFKERMYDNNNRISKEEYKEFRRRISEIYHKDEKKDYGKMF